MENREDALPTVAFTPAERAAWDALCVQAEKTLKARCAEYNIPELRYQPADDLMLVFRLPAKEMVTAGGLFVPDHGTYKDERGQSERVNTLLDEGVLLKAGCAARDYMRSHGILIGDIVNWGKFAGDESSSHRFQAGGVHAITAIVDWLKVPCREIHGCYDLDDRLAAKTMRIVYVEDAGGNGIHIVKPVPTEEIR